MPKFKKERVRATPYSKQKNNEMEVEVKNAPEIRDIDFKINDCIKEETKGVCHYLFICWIKGNASKT